MDKDLVKKVILILKDDVFGDGHPENTWHVVTELADDLNIPHHKVMLVIEHLVEKQWAEYDSSDDTVRILR